MVDLITENPAIAAYRAAMQEYDRRKAAEQSQETAGRQEIEARATQAGRVAGIDAENAMRVDNAGVSRETMPGKIAGTNADNARRVDDAAISRATVGDQIAISGDRRRLSELSVDDATNRQFFQVLDMLDKGDAAGAHELAQRNGVKIPPAVANNRLLVNQLNGLAKQAQTYYPTSPAKQAEYMQQAIAGLNASAGGRMKPQTPLNDPTYQYNVPGAPPPDTTKTAGRPLQFQVKYDAAKGLGYSDAEALAFANGQKPPTDMQLQDMARKIVNMELPSSDFSATQQTRRARFDEVLQQLRSTASDGEAQAVTGSAGGRPRGSGTSDDPYEAATQADIDWFKQNAKPGEAISVDGRLYTK